MFKFSKIALSLSLSVVAVLTACGSPENIVSTTTVSQVSTVTATKTTTSTVTVTLPVTQTVTATVTANPDNTPAATTTSPTTTPVPTTTKQDEYSYYHGYLLEGYPEDIWPVYDSLAISSCSLDIQFPVYNDTGVYHNVFYVVYITDGTQEEISDYYNSLLEETVEQDFYDAKGTVGGYEVTARFSPGSNLVYLSVVLPNKLGITSNPLLADFPEEQFPFYEMDDIWSEYFVCTSNGDGTIIYTKLFSFSGTVQEALDFYRALLGDAQDYEETIEEEYSGESIMLTGTIGDFSFCVTIAVWGNPDMINIWLERAS